jgi:hypothetical protein
MRICLHHFLGSVSHLIGPVIGDIDVDVTAGADVGLRPAMNECFGAKAQALRGVGPIFRSRSFDEELSKADVAIIRNISPK